MRSSRLNPTRFFANCACTLAAALALAWIGQSTFARGLSINGRCEVRPGTSQAPQSVASIECITPDGRASRVPSTGQTAQNAPATFMNDVLSCSLPEGETVFIIALHDLALRDRFTFINENSSACGELTIAVSNQRLPASSAEWTTVDGVVAFAHKRLFNLSILGVEAQYVKLSFRVERALDGIAANF